MSSSLIIRVGIVSLTFRFTAFVKPFFNPNSQSLKHNIDKNIFMKNENVAVF